MKSILFFLGLCSGYVPNDHNLTHALCVPASAENEFQDKVTAAAGRMDSLVLLCKANKVDKCLIKYGESPLSYEEFKQSVIEMGKRV